MSNSASIDSDHTHDLPGADETDSPDAHITIPQTTKSHNPHRLMNERTLPTIKYSDGSPLLSHGPTTATGYPPPLENDMGTLSHPMYTASSQTAITCWTPPTKSTIPLLSKNAYSPTHTRASSGQTIAPQSHPHNAQSTREFHQCTPNTNHTFKATHDTRTALPTRPPTPPRPSPTQEQRQSHNSTRGYITTYPPTRPSKRQRPASP